jgi:hypothetical protein
LDQSKLLQHIAEAENALVQRGRELLQEPGDHIEEEQALDDAMYFLGALRRIEVQTAPPYPQSARLERLKVA